MSRGKTQLLVVRLSALGDVIHTIPAVIALRDVTPDGNLSWIVEAPYRELVEIVAGVNPIAVRVRKWSRHPIASRKAIRETLDAIRSDIAVDFQGLVKSAVLMRLSGAGLRYGFSKESIREKAALLFTNRRIAVDTSLHVVEQNLQLARALSPEARFGRAAWETFAADPEGKIDRYAGSVVFLPGAGRPEKVWPAGRFRELASLLGGRAVAAWGPGERELAEQTGAAVAPETTLRELAALLRQAALVIGGDTGPLHLAAALGAPVIGLYGPTNPRRNGPYGQLDRCISHFGTTKSMASITVEEVMKVVERALPK